MGEVGGCESGRREVLVHLVLAGFATVFGEVARFADLGAAEQDSEVLVQVRQERAAILLVFLPLHGFSKELNGQY